MDKQKDDAQPLDDGYDMIPVAWAGHAALYWLAPAVLAVVAPAALLVGVAGRLLYDKKKHEGED